MSQSLRAEGPNHDTTTRTQLNAAHHVVISCDASNHNATKLLPVLVRYCTFSDGEIKIITNVLDIYDLKSETADAIFEVLMKTIVKYDLLEKVTGYLADNANVNFGSIHRRTDGNVHAKLENKLGRQIMSIGCGAHIIHNAISSATNKIIPFDIENIVFKIFQHFSIHTLRTEKLREFCDFIGVQYKKLLYHSKTRWLSLAPCTDRILFLYDALKSYFLSEENVPLVIFNFFSNNVSEFWLMFMQPQMEMFNIVIMKIERADISALEVAKTYINLQNQIQNRLDEVFIPFSAKGILLTMEEAGIMNRTTVKVAVTKFYTELLRYLEQWSDRSVNICREMEPFLLTVCCYDEFQSAIYFIERQFPMKIVDNENSMFDSYFVIQKCVKEYDDQWKAESISLIEKWKIVLNKLKAVDVSCARILICLEFVLSLPGANADGERVFSLVGNYWSDCKSRLSVECLESVVKTKVNVNLSCDVFFDVTNDPNLLAKVKSQDKY